jgi:hypothetical protein
LVSCSMKRSKRQEEIAFFVKYFRQIEQSDFLRLHQLINILYQCCPVKIVR